MNQESVVTVTAVEPTANPEDTPKAEKLTAVGELTLLLQKQKQDGLNLREQLRRDRLKKQIVHGQRQRKHQNNMFRKMYIAPQRKQLNALMNRVGVIRSSISKQDFQLLRELFTVQVPEQKNESGEVTQAAASYVNWYGLLQEGKNVIVVQREERIKAGLRKRTTGRRSDRASHRSAIDLILKRNAEETIKEAQKAD